MRINARLDAETERQLRRLTETTGRSVSDVVRESVASYYRSVIGARTGCSRVVAMAGKFDGGESDLSSRVKEIAGDALDEKWLRMQGAREAREARSRR